jgi:hypothetical protein
VYKQDTNLVQIEIKSLCNGLHKHEVLTPVYIAATFQAIVEPVTVHFFGNKTSETACFFRPDAASILVGRI